MTEWMPAAWHDKAAGILGVPDKPRAGDLPLAHAN